MSINPVMFSYADAKQFRGVYTQKEIRHYMKEAARQLKMDLSADQIEKVMLNWGEKIGFKDDETENEFGVISP